MQFFLNWVLLTLLYMLFDKCLVYIYVSFKVLVCIVVSWIVCRVIAVCASCGHLMCVCCNV
jgi:hypothetical protein